MPRYVSEKLSCHGNAHSVNNNDEYEPTFGQWRNNPIKNVLDWNHFVTL